MIMLKTKVIAIVSLKLQGKIKKIVHHLSSDKESWSVEKQDSDKKKSEIYPAGGTATLQEPVTIPKSEIFWRKLRDETIPTYSINVSGDYLEICANTCMTKVLVVAKKGKYPARKCRDQKKRDEMH
jgi:hypothetical protein